LTSSQYPALLRRINFFLGGKQRTRNFKIYDEIQLQLGRNYWLKNLHFFLLLGTLASKQIILF